MFERYELAAAEHGFPVNQVIDKAFEIFFSDQEQVALFLSAFVAMKKFPFDSRKSKQIFISATNPLFSVEAFTFFKPAALLTCFFVQQEHQGQPALYSALAELQKTVVPSSFYRSVLIRRENFDRVDQIREAWEPNFRTARIVNEALNIFLSEYDDIYTLKSVADSCPPNGALDTWRYLNVDHAVYVKLGKACRRTESKKVPFLDKIIYHLEDRDFEEAIESLAHQKGEKAYRLIDENGRISPRIVKY